MEVEVHSSITLHKMILDVVLFMTSNSVLSMHTLASVMGEETANELKEHEVAASCAFFNS